MGYESIDLDQLRQATNHLPIRQPFQHQNEAFKALTHTFRPDRDKPGSGILVLPTGAGKTFTAVKWLSDHIIPKNIKILWLAPSFYLLDQAFSEFHANARAISQTKKYLNIRCVSSNPAHARAASVDLTDDVVIMTIQTAISNLHPNALDGAGNPVRSAFKQYLDHFRDSEFFVVIDEAHHTPAYGCRHLLIGEQPEKPGIRQLLPKASFLGLTATPTHGEKSKRGWLTKIFYDGVVYEAKNPELVMQKILARPNYIQVSTGKQLSVDDNLYDLLVKQHRDLPEYIIEKLANDQERNDRIVSNYVENKGLYGKTIIFADRWFQCVYLKEKLLKRGIRAEAIYSHIDADPGSAEARNRRTQSENGRILEQFRTGKDEQGNPAPLDVLINVRMLTEGTDVPTVKTVFITRQTTSLILITQMMGRALRGQKAGGEDEANIVLFFDDWQRLIDWATPLALEGDTSDSEPTVRGYPPIEYISIRLVEKLARSMESGELPYIEFAKFFPVGWYKTEVVYADSDQLQDSMEPFVEFVLVYEHTQAKLSSFIEFITSTTLPDEWSKEYLSEAWSQPQIKSWMAEWFDGDTDNIGDHLDQDLTKVVRHIAQNQSVPDYHAFEERDYYDLDRIAQQVIDLPAKPLREYLRNEFSKPGTLWKAFYKSFDRFDMAVHGAISTILDGVPKDSPVIRPLTSASVVRELTEAEKEQIKQRDGYACLCCGVKNGRGVKLEIDHIIPLKFGGESTLDNSQTLCSLCNAHKGINELNFRYNLSLLKRPKSLELNVPYRNQDAERVLTRAINFFYHCKAVHKINCHKTRNGKHYHAWEVHLYAGNNPNWLLSHRGELLGFIQTELGCPHVQDIQVYAPT